VKALYALVFVVFSFAAPAQTLEASIAAYYLDDFDCLGETTRRSTMQPQIIAIEQICAALLDEGNVELAGANTPSDKKLTEDDTIEPSSMPPQSIAPEPTNGKLGDTMLNEADDVAITGPNDAEDIPVGAIQPIYDYSTEKYLTGRDDHLTVDDTSEPGAMPAQIIATEPTSEKLGE
jgi:hypothetical protein